jgi:heme exporter protein D
VTALLGELPALPLHEAGKYVAGAYVVLFALVLIYVSIMAIRQSKLERDLAELLAREQRLTEAGASEATEAGPAREAAAGAERPPSERESTLA